MATATKENGLSKTADASTVVIERETEFIPFMAKDAIRLSVSIVKKLVCVPTRSGKVCSDREAIRFIMLCKARGLNPYEGDAYLIGYESRYGSATFSLITAHQAFLKRAETHPEYDGMESGVMVVTKDKELIDREGDFTLDTDTVVGGWATVFFKTRSHPSKKRLKLSTFNTGQGRWNKDAAGMISKCAEADALRSSFPSTLGGMYLEDELADMADQTPEPAQRSNKLATRSNLTDEIASDTQLGGHAPADIGIVDEEIADPAEQPYQHTEPASVDPPQECSDPTAELFKGLNSQLEKPNSLKDINTSRAWAKAEALKIKVENESERAEVLNEIDITCDEALTKFKDGRGEASNAAGKTTQRHLGD